MAAPRRSKRIAASREGSRAGSVVSDDNRDGLSLPSPTELHVSTQLLTRRTPVKVSKTTQKKAKSSVFDAIVAIDRIVFRNDRQYISQLTKRQQEAVIAAFTDREQDLRRELERRDAAIEQLRQERDAARARAQQKRTLRESLFYEKVHRQQENARSTPAITKQSSPPPQRDSDSSALVIYSTPPTSTPPQQMTTETPKASLLGRIFRTIASPFASRASDSAPPSAVAAEPQRSLGELPQSRKRPAPEPEHSSEPRPTPTPQRTSQSRGKTSYQPAALEPISEQTEASEQQKRTMAEPTPSRPPRSVAKVRQNLRQQTTPTAKTPSRAWTRQQPPKEPNADARLEKLRRFQAAKQAYEDMKEDEDIREIAPRPTKRVKIDDLVAIPHNRPGDAEGTFRVYDVDSDDEMEVDEDDAQIRQNIFERSKTQQQEEKKELPQAKKTSQVQQQPPPPPPPKKPLQQPALGPQEEHATPPVAADEEEPMVFQFPSVGLKPENEEESEWSNQYLAAKFAYGFAEWQRSGQLVVEWGH